MRVVLVGNGGRESALAWAIARSPQLSALAVTRPSPGWPAAAELRPASAVTEILAVAKQFSADLLVVGPEAPLAEGLADAAAAQGLACFGPTRAAARLEWSKAYAKEVLQATGVPTAGHQVVDLTTAAGQRQASARVEAGPVVVKADGLAAGKGVFVCQDASEARAALQQVAALGAAAQQVVLEDLLTGPEVSLLALCDGERAVALPLAQDHKRLLDGDLGPNTGGMGAYAPCPLLDAAEVEALLDQIHRPVLAEMARRGAPLRGVLYAGLMLTPAGPRVLEFNTRFGDPECQALLPLLDEDLLPWLSGAARGQLPGERLRLRAGAACCVVLAAPGYPGAPTLGEALPEPGELPQVLAFHAATTRDAAGVLRVAGGRVLGLTGLGEDLQQAHARAYAAVEAWRFPGALVRRDIGKQGLAR